MTTDATRDDDVTRPTSAPTGEPGAGEKSCPFCAETIRAAAIRCRWCGSDLPEEPATEHLPPEGSTPADAPDDSVPGDPASEEAAEPAGEDPEPAATPRRPWLPPALAAALLVLVVLASVVFVRMLLQADAEPEAVRGTDPGAPGAEVVSEGAKSAGLAAATEATEAVLGYSAKTLDEDVERARGLLGGEMAQEYVATMEAIREDTEKDAAAVEATVVASSIISAGEQRATALLFVNQTTTGKHLQEPRTDLNRVVVTLERDAGDWTMTDLTAL